MSQHLARSVRPVPRPPRGSTPLFGKQPVAGVQEAETTEQDAQQAERLAAMHRLLLQAYGQPAPREVWDPLTQLIYSLCSSRTKTPESHVTLRALRERYNGWPKGPNSWDEVRWEPLRDAPVPEIEGTIQLATFADRKAPQLKATLEQITARTGILSLAFLARYRTGKVRAWIEQFPGIGSQVSAAVVNFSSLRRPVISVDGHHQRVSHSHGIRAGTQHTAAGRTSSHARRSVRLERSHHGRSSPAGQGAGANPLHAEPAKLFSVPAA